MKRIGLVFAVLHLTACGVIAAQSVQSIGRHAGDVSVTSPTTNSTMSSVHYVAKSSTTCPRGIAAMGIYTAQHRLAYVVQGSQLDTTLNLAAGTYDTVVQEWDNCEGAAKIHVPVTVQVASTTIASELANNTSAADTFQSQSNNNLGAGNTSKVDIHTLLYPGATTEIFAEIQPWFGDRRHMKVGYVSWDPTQVDKQLTDMESRGITGVVIDWYGPADKTEPTTLAWLAAAGNHPNFKVMIMIDKGAISISPCAGCSPQQSVIYLTNYILQNYATSASYATFNNKPVITQFDLDLHYKLDWNAIQKATSPNIAWIFENSGGFAHPVSSGSWSWMNATSKQYGMDYLTSFYNQAASYPQQMVWGAGYKGFNDTLASWSLHRVVGQQCGQTWLQTFNMINKYYNSSNQLPVLQLVTWNDYEEGTEIESGIDNCLTVSGTMSGSILHWQVNGNENTVDHYVVYFSPDGQSLQALNNLPAGSSAMDLSPYNLGSGSIYVQAVGKPMIRNQMSVPVTLSAGG